jgi:hypothetical protein
MKLVQPCYRLHTFSKGDGQVRCVSKTSTDHVLWHEKWKLGTKTALGNKQGKLKTVQWYFAIGFCMSGETLLLILLFDMMKQLLTLMLLSPDTNV